jgi:hypothetical protein
MRSSLTLAFGLALVSCSALAGVDLQASLGIREVEDVTLVSPASAEAPSSPVPARGNELVVASHVAPMSWPFSLGAFYSTTTGGLAMGSGAPSVERMEGSEIGPEVVVWWPGWSLLPYVKFGKSLAGAWRARVHATSFTLSNAPEDGLTTTLGYRPEVSHVALGFGWSPVPRLAFFVQGDASRGTMVLDSATQVGRDVYEKILIENRWRSEIPWESRKIALGLEMEI